jgi:ammonium transporter, Amt family
MLSSRMPHTLADCHRALLALVLGTGACLLPAVAHAADAPTINAGDTAWMLMSTALVLMMTIPGLALFYGGLVRKGNVLTTMAQSFATTCLIAVLWVIVGYSLTFGDGNEYIGDLSRVLVRNVAMDTPFTLGATSGGADDHSGNCLYDVPDDVRHYHAGSDCWGFC